MPDVTAHSLELRRRGRHLPQVFVDLFRQLPEDVELAVVAHSSVVADVEKATESERARSKTTIVEAPSYLHSSVWAESPYVVVEDVGSDTWRRVFVEPFTFPRGGDSVVAPSGN